MRDSNLAIQVLAEVLQQQARLDDPTAAARQEFERCEDSINAQWSIWQCLSLPSACIAYISQRLYHSGSTISDIAFDGDLPAGLLCWWSRKVRGQLPALTEAELQQYRSALYGVAAAVGHAPKMSLAGVPPYSPSSQTSCPCARWASKILLSRDCNMHAVVAWPCREQ